jgi:hypothetical protein
VPRDLLPADTADADIRPYQYWIITFDGTRRRKVRRERGISQERLSFRSRVSPDNRCPDVALTHARGAPMIADDPCPPSGLTDPELRIFIDGRQAADGAFYQLSSGQQVPVSDPPAAAASICPTQPAAVLALTPCHRSSRPPLKEPDLGHQPANVKA